MVTSRRWWRICVVARYRALQCVAVCYSVLQCVAVCYSVLQCVAVCYSVLQCAVFDNGRVEELRVYLLVRVGFSNCNLIIFF